MSWSWSRLKIIFKRSLGIGLERQKNQDKINTKQNNHKESKKWTPGWLVVEIRMLTFKHKVAGKVWFYNFPHFPNDCEKLEF